MNVPAVAVDELAGAAQRLRICVLTLAERGVRSADQALGLRSITKRNTRARERLAAS